MKVLQLLLPTALLVFFLYKAVRVSRVFLLGIPFLMYMGSSIFFEQLRVFWIPARLEPTDLIFIWLVIVWLIASDVLVPRRTSSAARGPRRRNPFGPAPLWPEEGIVLVIAAFVIFVMSGSALQHGSFATALGEAKGVIEMLVGYLLIRGIVSGVRREHLISFLGALVLANTVAAALFIVHQGFGFTVYTDVTEYQVLYFMGERITRSFTFMPQFLALSLAWAFASSKWNLLTVAVVFISLIALWVTFTRSLLVIGIVEGVLVLMVRLLKAREVSVFLRRALSAVVMVGIVAAFVLVFMPAQSSYFLSRIDQATSASSITEERNLANRQGKVVTTWDWIEDDRLAGLGFVSGGQDARTTQMEQMAADIVWVPVLYRLGLIGAALFVVLYLTVFVRNLRDAFRRTGRDEYFALVMACVVIATLLEGFVSWTFFNPFKFPLGLWVFGIAIGGELARRATAGEEELARRATAGEEEPARLSQGPGQATLGGLGRARGRAGLGGSGHAA